MQTLVFTFIIINDGKASFAFLLKYLKRMWPANIKKKKNCSCFSYYY